MKKREYRVILILAVWDVTVMYNGSRSALEEQTKILNNNRDCSLKHP